MKRVLSLFLALVMVLQYVPATVFAAAEDNLCAHHAEHTADCGYAEEQPGSECTHTHSMECYAVNECAHIHGEECAETCGHDCTKDISCWQSSRICGHESLSQCGQECFQPICAHAKGQHDGSCGYIPATEAQPCLYECADCAAPEEPSTETTAPVEVAHEHEYTSDVTVPTCKEKGYTTYTCDCGDSYVDTYVSATGHKRSNGICTVCGDSFAGKKVSILSHSMSTYAGVSNNTAYNSTIGKNDVYYTEGRHGVYLKDTWWMQTIDALGMELLVNNSWSGSCIFQPRKGEASVGYGDRAVNLHNDHTGEEPDVILVYLGCNDFAYFKDTFGTANSVDYDSIILYNGDGTFAYAGPTTACEAYAIMLHKVQNRYPDAEIYCMTSTARREVDYTGDTYPDAGQPTLYSAELHNVAKYFGFPVIDLENAISKEVEIFDKYIGDKRAHANALGMDQITNEVISVMLGRDAEIRHVTSEADVVAQRAVLLSGSYSAKVNLQDGYTVTVTMDGKDITAEAYKNGKITVQKVTGDIAVSVAVNRDSLNFGWALADGALISTGENKNSLTKLAGTITDGMISNGRYEMEAPVLLKHDLPWEMEWKFAGDWRGSVLVSDPAQKTNGMHYITRTKGGQLCFGTWNGNQYDNYGVDLSSLNDQPHTYRLVNRIAADGSNMVWLYVDGTELGPMNNYYIGSNSQNKTSDWVSGKDFLFSYIGMEGHPLNNCRMDYIKIQEDSHSHTYEASVTAPTCKEKGYTTYTCACGDSYVDDYVDAIGEHTYENGICTGCGATVSPYLQQLPENIVGCTNLYDSLVPVKGYYTATKYDTSNGSVLSVVIPVEPGDRIAASSFGPVSENMGSVNGIRVTYLLGDEIVTSLSAGDVYNVYTKNGYITVPEGVDVVCIPWWAPSDSNWLTLGQISKNFATHSPKAVPAQAPTCTENGYTAGEICEICNASLGSREEIPATGHDYGGNTCTVCGTVNILAILDGKYVSILGDSISTFNGYSNDATVNTTIGGNGPRYNAGTADTKPGSYCLLESVDDTWWMHFANRSGMKLLVNNSWAGSQVFGGQTSDGRVIPAAYLERCVNLHDNTVENNPNNAPINPDVIFVYLGINDYNFNRSNVGNGAVDYAALINSDGTYVTPATFGEAYGILLHKMQKAYPNAQIFAITLLPENLYSVDKTAWEQHNAYIRAAAEYYDIPLVDLAENCAITWENYSSYMIDKIHPTTAGMKLISDCIETELLSYYKENPPYTHAPVITQQPVNAEAKLGERFCVTVEAEGEGLTYQWYFRNAGSDKWYKSGVTDNTYDDVMTTARAGREVYCVITDANGNSVTTETAKLICVPGEELAITKQPENGEAVMGERYCVTVEAKGDNLKYQWYFRNKGATSWTKSGVRDNTYDDVMTTARADREIYCVITDAYGNKVTSDTVKLIRIPMKLEITQQPADSEASLGDQFCVTVLARGEGLKYQWYYRNEGGLIWYKSGVQDNTYDDTMTKARMGREVYCVITDAWGNKVTTETAKLIGVPDVELKILAQPEDDSAPMGEKFCITVEAQGDGLTYQWYFRNKGGSVWYKSGVKDNTYDDVMTRARAGRDVYCVITDAYGNQLTTQTAKIILK